MSYQVLARKWRPQNFKQMVGQEHVLQALIHALESQRLHHAYLFTGTRGVGKTTIGRILAKCLSCDTGITAEPCGNCSACVGITEGRYVDLIEIDAASRTKVEDMRELLENVQYAPSEGRFKIYLIDEVHMLSQSSFNALLKTLEEPPEHVKFLFATTDPQKLPVTILSRCLQFNLKNMPPERIVGHLKNILSEEQVTYEEPALWSLARAADGSMRDALSLTDQAIAYGHSALKETEVSAMLGTVDQKRIYRILESLISNDPESLLREVQALAEFSPDYASVLASLTSVLHRVAIEQAVPGATDNAMGDRDTVRAFANQLCAEDVQLFYQIALVSRKDIGISPDPKSALEMALLRMLAFQLNPAANQPEMNGTLSEEVPVEKKSSTDELTGDAGVDLEAQPDSDAIQSGVTAATESAENAKAAVLNSSPEHASETEASPSVPPSPETSAATVASSVREEPIIPEPPAIDDQLADALAAQHQEDPESDSPTELAPHQHEPTAMTLAGAPEEIKKKTDPENLAAESPAPHGHGADVDNRLNPASEAGVAHADEWPKLATQLGLSGMTLNLLLNMYMAKEGDTIRLFVESGHYRLLNRSHESRISDSLRSQFTDVEQVIFVDGLHAGFETPMMWKERRMSEKLADAKEALTKDKNILRLIDEFDANVLPESIVALGSLHD